MKRRRFPLRPRRVAARSTQKDVSMSLRIPTLALAGGLLLIAGPASALAKGASPVAIAAAVAATDRPAADTALDASRKPAELLVVAGLKAGETIVDVFPGPYWDRLFSKVVGPTGKVIAFQSTEMAKAEQETLPANGASPIEGYPNVVAYSGPINGFSISSPVDVVWMRQNYHDLYDPFMGPANVPAFNKLVFNALKKGGLYVIIDHSAPARSGLEDTNTTHRIDAAVVKLDMAAAGFKFVGESNVLRNTADPRDKLVFDKSIRGKTDQFVYVFKKP
jgi:predicted methyltransferase